MNYKTLYQKLIEKATDRNTPNCYIERHHILPKSLGGSDEPDNLVDLTAREHFIAHLLLAKIYGGPMIYAAYAMMYMNDNKYVSRKYAWLKEEYSKINKQRRHTEETKKKIKEARKKQICVGKPHSLETKQKLSIIAKNRTTEHLQKIKEARAKQIISEETKQKISDANKGKIISEETRNKISVAQKGKIISEETREKLRCGMIGKKASQETKEKMSAARKGKSSHRKGKTLPKPVCRIEDKKEMDIANFMKWFNKRKVC